MPRTCRQVEIRPTGKADMIRLDAFFLYQAAYSIHPLAEIKPDSPLPDSFGTLYVAQYSLDQLLNQSVYQLKSSRAAGLKLLDAIKAITDTPERTEPLNY